MSRRQAGAAAVAVLAVAVLAATGGALPPPPVDPSSWGAWVEGRGAVPAAMALVRLGALGAAVWVGAASLVAVSARSLGAGGVAAAAERALPPPLRRAAAGLGLASAVVLGGVPAAGADPGDGTATMTVLGPETVEDEAPAPAAAPPPAPVAAPAPAPPETWTVAPGDSFWSIAADVVAEAAGRPPTDAEVDPYWRALVAANRDRLVSPNPDLILPGQTFVLPSFSPGGGGRPRWRAGDPPG